MAAKIQENIVDFGTSQNSVSVSSFSLQTAAFSTSPAIVRMLIKPKSKSCTKPVSPVEHVPKMIHQQDFFRLQKDNTPNSPSAALRVRALRALKSPNRANIFDVPHAEQSIITEEERNPRALPTLSEVLKDVIVYVEVRTGNDNRSEGVKSIIAKLGAQVNDRLLRNTTHVVFKDGLMSTYKRAQSWNIPIVSILWIEACKVQRRLCEPQQFPISNIHLYEHPELYGKMARVRCMQPDSELNKRPRKRQGTPTNVKDQENVNSQRLLAGQLSTPTNVMTDYFRPLSQRKHLTEGINESPATQLLNRINNGLFTPVQAVNKKADDASVKKTPVIADHREMGDVAHGKPAAQKTLDFNTETDVLTLEIKHVSKPPRVSRRSSSLHLPVAVDKATDTDMFEPRVTRRRSSMLCLSKTAEVEVNNTPKTPVNQSKERKTRRRTTYECAMSTEVEVTEQTEAQVVRRRSMSSMSMEISTPKTAKKPCFQSIAEEPLNNKTNYDHQTMEMSPSYSHVICKSNGRRTVYARNAMVVSDHDSENFNPYLEKFCKSNVLAQPSLDSFTTTKTSPDSFEDGTPVFSSTRLPASCSTEKVSNQTNRRRSLFNVDLELAKERLNQMISTSAQKSLSQADEAGFGQCNPVTPLQAVALKVQPIAEVIDSAQPKMRRLFTPNDEVVVSPPKSVKKTRKSTSAESINTSSAVKRRRTLAATPKPTAEVGPNLQIDSVINEAQTSKGNLTDSTSDTPLDQSKSSKRQIFLNTLVHTNMHKEQVQVIHKALRKLRGMRIDPTVTKRTTHLVSLEPRRTLNMLRGLMRGVWILNFKWILDSMEANKWLPEEKYELTSFSRSIEICRTERQAFGASYRCELFRYMETFYVSSLCRPVTFNNVKELLLLGGAKLTENRYKAKYIIGDKRRADDDRIYLTPNWVLDSITAMQIQRFANYLMRSAIVTPYGIRYESPRGEPRQHGKRYESPRVESGTQNDKFLKIIYRDPPLVMQK